MPRETKHPDAAIAGQFDSKAIGVLLRREGWEEFSEFWDDVAIFRRPPKEKSYAEILLPKKHDEKYGGLMTAAVLRYAEYYELSIDETLAHWRRPNVERFERWVLARTANEEDFLRQGVIAEIRGLLGMERDKTSRPYGEVLVAILNFEKGKRVDATIFLEADDYATALNAYIQGNHIAFDCDYDWVNSIPAIVKIANLRNVERRLGSEENRIKSYADGGDWRYDPSDLFSDLIGFCSNMPGLGATLVNGALYAVLPPNASRGAVSRAKFLDAEHVKARGRHCFANFLPDGKRPEDVPALEEKDKMTIAELIEELKKYDGAGTVGICFWNGGWDARDATAVSPDDFGVSIIAEEDAL